jgi:4'-phosphopantetheinyl transferase
MPPQLAPAVHLIWAARSADSLAHRLLAAELSRIAGIAASDVHIAKMCGTCGSSEHGQPSAVMPTGIRAPHVSLARADGMTMVAVTQAGPVGVDVERVDAASFDRFGDVALHPREQPASGVDPTITWVRKESVLKAHGLGVGVDPRHIWLTSPGSPPELVAWEASDPPSKHVWIFDVHLPGNGYVAAVTVMSDERPSVMVRSEGREDSSGTTRR